jgi:RecA/RadA recombinase
MLDLPAVVEEINKKKKTTKITTLSRARAFTLKRFFSGSFGVDRVTGGGFAYRRIQLIFGAKSCIDGDSFLYYELWRDGKRMNSKGGSIRRLYERFSGDISEGSKYGRHFQQEADTFYVKSVDDTGRVIRNEILDVVKTGKKSCYNVKVAHGENLISTAEHKYLTPVGYKQLSELKVGDILYINTNNRIKGRKKSLNRPEIFVKYHPYLPTKIVKDNYKGKETDYLYYRGQKARMVYEAFLNGFSLDEYKEFLDTKTKNEINNLRFLPTTIHIHHKDEDFLNNDISNLELIDPSEHGKVHMQDRLSNLQIIVEETPIVSIEYAGERETFDIQCAYPYNNYIANSIVVHNSGKNALLNQTTAYLQRQCKLCHNIHPAYMDGLRPKDNWAAVLSGILGYGTCKCDNPISKKVFVLDFERALAIEEPRVMKANFITDSKTGEEIDELDYNDTILALEELKNQTEKHTDEQKAKIKELEKFIKNVKIEEQVIHQLATLDYLKKCGVNSNELMVSDPEDTEEGIELVRDMIKSKAVDAIIWDSLQAAIPRYVKGREADQATMGVEAKQNGLLMRHVCSAFAAHDLTDESEAYKPALFITSQVRASLGGFVQTPDTYSGGNAIQHHISLALEIKKEKYLREDGSEAEFKEDFYGQITRIRADKNKLSAPGDMFQYDYYFREGSQFLIGIDIVGELANLGVKLGVIERAGAYYKLPGTDKGIQGMANLRNYFRENPGDVCKLYIDIANKK